AKIYYARVGEDWRKEAKYKFLDDVQQRSSVEWQKITPDKKNTWLREGLQDAFDSFMPIGSKEDKAASLSTKRSIFATYSGGVKTNRDVWAYNFNPKKLAENIKLTIETFNEQSYKWTRIARDKSKLDSFVTYDDSRIAWSRDLKLDLLKGRIAQFSKEKIRHAIYRPFVKSFLFFDRTLNEEVYAMPSIFPLKASENKVICLTAAGNSQAFQCLVVSELPDIHLTGDSQCFPLYTYNEEGTNRRENITDWALAQFRAQYKSKSISKLDIFHYVYALLHHPTYRTTYAANLKRELPRIPFVASPENFRAFVRAGERLAELHVNYEAQPECKLEHVENEDAALDWRVERMRLSKDKQSIVYNDFLTLEGIPLEAFEYRLGNRSALEWIVDQYQVSTDKRSGITNDPNRADEPDYIVKLIGKVTTVSVETVKTVRGLPALQLSE
ncbi:MAG: DNA helicase, partial [Acidobacteria bacterium]|nr:DNA helicase [Acidobacteriota bacterium]